MQKNIRLGLNIDHVATLRQQRGGLVNYPSVLDAAQICMASGADLITVHLRGDRRHIQEFDLADLSSAGIPLNLEIAATDEMIGKALKYKPLIVCLVPEKREELTTEGGLNVIADSKRISMAITKLWKSGIKVSLFIESSPEQVQAAKDCGAHAVEFHTGHYALEKKDSEVKKHLEKLNLSCLEANRLEMKVHAGHGLDYSNIDAIKNLPHLEEVNIGHSIVCHSVFVGLAEATRKMKSKLL